MKIGIIRCMQTEDYCPGTGDFKAVKNRTGVFEGITEEIEIIGFTNCGGCPAKKGGAAGRRTCKEGCGYRSFCQLHI